jgi:hypothetical protein
MKCDTCLYLVNIPPQQDQPYPEIFCAKGHWDGGPFETDSFDLGDPTKGVWDDCKDFNKTNDIA